MIEYVYGIVTLVIRAEDGCSSMAPGGMFRDGVG